MTNDLIAAGLDLGSAITRCVLCTVERGRLSVIAAAAENSQGWQKGRVADRAAVAETVRRVVRECEKQARVSVEGAVLGLGGPHIEGLNSRGLYEFGRPREVTANDMTYAVELAARVRLPEDRLLLHVLPQDFTADGRSGFRNPREMVCSRLEANVHLVTASHYEHQALVAAVHQAHLAVEETVFEGVAAAYAALLPADRSRGVALVDVGASGTNIAVYDGDALLLAAALPLSADHFTRDVSQILPVAYDDAERLKREYGCAMLYRTSGNSSIEIPSRDGRPSREVARRDLNEILEARAEELFTYVRSELTKVGMEQALLEGVVLSGGGALLQGMCDMAERVLNCPCRNALPLGFENWPAWANTPDWTAAAGLAMYAARLKARREGRRKTGGLLGLRGR